MSIPSYRSHEPLYIIIVRNPNAANQLSSWAKNNNIHAVIESNRMKIYEQNSLHMFRLHWPHNWDSVTIWDCWNKRHIDGE